MEITVLVFGRESINACKELWRFAINYLKAENEIKKILFAYSTVAFKTQLEYLERYPEDEWARIIGIHLSL